MRGALSSIEIYSRRMHAFETRHAALRISRRDAASCMSRLSEAQLPYPCKVARHVLNSSTAWYRAYLVVYSSTAWYRAYLVVYMRIVMEKKRCLEFAL